MSDDATPRLSLPYLAAAQAQKHVTVNEALALLDGLVQTAIESRSVAAQPAAPRDGDLYLLPAGATGADWGSQSAGTLMRFEAGAWNVLPAPTGLIVFVKDDGRLLVRLADDWHDLGFAIGELRNLGSVGIGADSDAAHPLLAKLNSALLTARALAEGGTGDLRLTLNKEAAGAIGSLLLQTGYSGRAEIGLCGDDDLHIRVSSDGSAWTEALAIKRDSGRVKAPANARFSAYTNFDNYVPLGTPSKVQFNMAEVNEQGAFDAVSHAFTATAAGLHVFGASLPFRKNAATPDSMTAEFYRNEAPAGRARSGVATPADGISTLNLTAALELAVGEVVDVRITLTGADGYVASANSGFWGQLVA